MAALRKDERANAMYKLYQQGKSLSEVAIAFDVTRQTVYKIFATRGFALRPLPIRKPYQEFNWNKYTKGRNGYYRKTYGDRSYMHRDVWEFYNGPIPDGWDIHHKDGNKSNNDISNLECLPKSEHTRIYSPHNNQYTKGRKRHANA
jgi:Helix-turn-helix domain of resolvase./HNH endonuclease.